MLFPIFISIVIVSLASFAGVLLLSFSKKLLSTWMLYLVSFATGSMFANVFFHLLPEMTEKSPDIHFSFGLVLVGILLSFVVEKFIHWHHCHNLECTTHSPVGTMVLIGDAMHNIIDGALIATAYLVSVPLGIATTLAVLSHEIPQEIGDFAVLLHSGFSKAKALLWNFASALTALIGAVVVIFADSFMPSVELWLLPIVAGNFLYIAGSDLIPTLHKESKLKPALLQVLCMVIGIGIIFAVSAKGHVHSELLHDTEPGHEEDELHLDELHGSGILNDIPSR